jgi:hypothetical protein
MNSTQIFWPILAQIILTIGTFIVLGVRKSKAIRTGMIDLKKMAIDNRGWPDTVLKASNNIANQFETPILFYIICVVLYVSNGVSLTTLSLSWVYVLSRYAHTVVHVGSNHVPTRMRIFIFGCSILFTMVIFSIFSLSNS